MTTTVSEPDVVVIPVTFEQVVEDEEPAIPCECSWHRDRTGESEWVVVVRELCCRPSGPRTWCNDCLQEVMTSEAWLTCGVCHLDVVHPFRARDLVISIEPLRRGRMGGGGGEL